MIHALRRGLGAWWFAPMPASRLAAVRIACGVYTLAYLLPRHDMFARLWRKDADLFDPVGVARLLAEPLPAVWGDVLFGSTAAAAVLFTVGLWHRVIGPALAVLL